MKERIRTYQQLTFLRPTPEEAKRNWRRAGLIEKLYRGKTQNTPPSREGESQKA